MPFERSEVEPPRSDAHLLLLADDEIQRTTIMAGLRKAPISLDITLGAVDLAELAAILSGAKQRPDMIVLAAAPQSEQALGIVRALRGLPLLRDIPAIVAMGSSDDPRAVDYARAGATAVVSARPRPGSDEVARAVTEAWFGLTEHFYLD